MAEDVGGKEDISVKIKLTAFLHAFNPVQSS